MLRYGILGFGLHAEKRLMPGFKFATRSQPVAFWRHNQARAEETAERFGLRSYETPESLCAAEDVDAIFVTTPDAMHLEHVEMALRAGKHVFCEKPMAMNSAQCEQMIATANVAGRLLGVAQIMRVQQALNTARAWVAQGRLGKVLHARCEFVYPAEHSPRTWITDATFAAGGPTADVGAHCFDALRYALRDEVTAVSAIMQQDEKSGTVEANAAVDLSFKGGTLAQVFVSARGPYRTYLEVVGLERTLECRNLFWVDGPVELVLVQEGREVERVGCDNSRAYGQQFDAFAASVIEGKPLPASGKDGLENQRIIDAAYASAREGRIISVPQ